MSSASLNKTCPFNSLVCISGVTGSLLGGGGGRSSSGSGLEDGIAMIFSLHIYCAQSKVKWGGGGHGVNWGSTTHKYATGLY